MRNELWASTALNAVRPSASTPTTSEENTKNAREWRRARRGGGSGRGAGDGRRGGEGGIRRSVRALTLDEADRFPWVFGRARVVRAGADRGVVRVPGRGARRRTFGA